MNRSILFAKISTKTEIYKENVVLTKLDQSLSYEFEIKRYFGWTAFSVRLASLSLQICILTIYSSIRWKDWLLSKGNLSLTDNESGYFP